MPRTTSAIPQRAVSPPSLHLPIFVVHRASKMFSSKFTFSIISAVCLAGGALAAPAPAPVAAVDFQGVGLQSVPLPVPTVLPASSNPNTLLWQEDTAAVDPQPIRGTLGAKILGPQNFEVQLQNADLLAPPSTDSGTVYVFPLLTCWECAC